MTALTHITAGILPLLDSVLLVLAREKGFAQAQGIELQLVRETSWANIRDRAAVGHFDIAQMLAPMPLAAALGLNPVAVDMITPMVLGLGNNAITVSAELWSAMRDAGAPDNLDPLGTGQALAKVVGASVRKLRFGVVHQSSSHNYELRYWMAANGISPDRDVEIVVLPPPLLPDALGSGGIDGYCVGEPWNSVGVATKGARIATVKAAIWRSSPDKVLGMRAAWAQDNPATLAALIRAMHFAAIWCSEPANHAEIADIMSAPAYLGQPAELLQRALDGRLDIGGGQIATVPDFYVPFAHAANFPWQSHALWFYSQMVRWGEVGFSPALASRAAATFRPDLYRAALAPLGVVLPADNARLEQTLPARSVDGLAMGPEGFFDDRNFDPSQLQDYIESQRHLG
jgi:two-component system, oxyanion-binding sensor